MTQLYTVRNSAGEVIAAHVDLAEAAREILQYDGASYAIEKDGDEWKLFTKSLNGKWDRRYPVEFSLENDEDAATTEMFQKVVNRAQAQEGWGADATPDEVYERELNDLIADGDEDDREFFGAALAEWKASK